MTVRNQLTSNGEKILYIAPDGKMYNMHDPAMRSVIRMSGWGMPTPEIAFTRGPYQHGSNPLSVRIPNRLITMQIRHVGCSRNEYWDMRYGLVDALRVSRTNLDNPIPGKLRWYRSNGEIRQLDVITVDGPKFAALQPGWSEFGYSDIITFAAYNPIIYNPTEETSSLSGFACTPTDMLQFPFSFNPGSIVFGIEICTLENTLAITYPGTWQTFPRIIVTGPATNFQITNQATGDMIRLDNYTIPDADSAVFDLTYGYKTIILTSSQQSLLGYVSEDSNLGTFSIEPDPIAPGGVNNFEISISNGLGSTSVVLTYNNRYIGI